MNWKKSLSIVGTLIMVVGQNIAGVTAFAETISNQESIIEDIYFEKNNTKISEITLEQGKEETITFVDENKEDEEAIVTLPELTKLNLSETNSQLDDASTVNYDQETNKVKIVFKNKEQNIKRTNLVLTTTDSVGNNQERMYAKVIRQDSQIYTSKPVTITTTSSENNKQQEEIQKNEEDGESAQQSSTNSESSNSLDINSLNKEQKNEVENNSNVDSTESTSVKKELQDKEESKIKRVIESRSNIDANIPTPPASSTNILDYFNVPNLGNASNAASVNDDYPQSVTINPNSTGQFGVMWANTVIDLTNDFDMSAYVYMYNPINPEKHGDGLNFVLQNDSNENKAYGQTGWGIGTYGTSSEAKIKNALAFEMDTYYNGSGSELGIDVIGDGQTQNLQKVNYNGHIAVLETNKDVSSDYASASGIDTGHGGNFGQMTHNNVQYGTDTNPVFGNKWKNFKVHWDSANQIITYELEGFNPTNYHVSDLNQTFGGKLVRFGFTGSTGSSTEYNLVSFNQLPVAPVTVFYKDIDTNEEIADSELLTGKLGDSWKSEQKDIDQYEFVKVDKKTEGSFTQTAQEVTYFYRKLLPKVEVKKSVDKETAKVGDELTYTITAKNSGEGNWNGTITDKIPTEYVNLVSGTTTVNGEKVEDNDVWKDNVLNVKQTIKAGESVTITFKVKTIKAAEGQTIANVAETDDPNVPPTPPAETKVPKVELTKTADKANAKVGEEITYTITAKNSGNGDWENGTITDKIPTEYVNLVSGTTTVNGEKVEDNDVWKDNVLNVKQTIKAGESVTITFKVKTIKAAEGQTIANVAETDDPNVPPTPPAETKVPIEPTIHKNIEGVQKLVLKNNKQKFNWNITVSFGTNTMNWKQASITDSVNNLLDIVEVTVVDENGKDVTGNGTLSTENNEVVFEINKKDASYTYLARHTYTMTITTKIKGSVTDKELAPYIKDGGIPNQADLNFGNEGDKKHSEIPKIVPLKGASPEKTNTPSNQTDKGNLTPSKGIFPHTGENQMLSNILLVVGTCILIILTVYYILKKRRIE
ncbi:isopeptide-forming domain-containing fimbrial protein [Enterococcus faecalis]|uniref:lectin-like domain-containing protein n=2 Tax=Enterococcus faecalis TaxID=1351 RepID=UPI00215765F3|nr:isopeptide-forming domain-containing fimbrial protein [Enterococcus faecalis]